MNDELLQILLAAKAADKCKMGIIPPHNGQEFRAGGDVICEKCGEKYIDHPMDLHIKGYDGKPFLNVICDGSRVKL